MKTELNLSNNATKSDLKYATGVDTSTCAKNIDLERLKSDVDKLDIVKLKKAPSGLSSFKNK